jgi:L-asparagine permease
MWNDPEAGRRTPLLAPLVALLLVAGWFRVRGRVAENANRERSGLTR